MDMKDYTQLRAAQEAAEMMREAVAIQISNLVSEGKAVSKALKNAYRECCLSVESTTRDIHNCLNTQAMIDSIED